MSKEAWIQVLFTSCNSMVHMLDKQQKLGWFVLLLPSLYVNSFSDFLQIIIIIITIISSVLRLMTAIWSSDSGSNSGWSIFCFHQGIPSWWEQRNVINGIHEHCRIFEFMLCGNWWFLLPINLWISSYVLRCIKFVYRILVNNFRFFLKDCSEFQCWMSNSSIKYCDGCYSVCVPGIVYKALILHPCGYPCLYHPLCSSWINWPKWGLLYLEGWQVGLSCLYWCFSWGVVCVSRDWPSCCSKSLTT